MGMNKHKSFHCKDSEKTHPKADNKYVFGYRASIREGNAMVTVQKD
jgi:hypothetical protein